MTEFFFQQSAKIQNTARSWHNTMAENRADPESVGAGPLNVAPAVAPCVVVRQNRQTFLWSRVHLSQESATPPPRSGAASVVVQGKLYMFGGYGGGTGRLDDFWSFSFDTNIWEEVKVLSDARPGCRENNGVVISDSSKSIYLFGGYNGNSWLNDLWRFDIESHAWTCIQESSDPRPADETNMAIGDHDGEMAGDVVRGDVPSRRFGYVSVVHDNKLILFGGFDGVRWKNDMYSYDFTSKTWMEIQAKGTLPSVRSCPAFAKDETSIYIQGGYDGLERKDDLFKFNCNTYTWTQMPCMGITPSPRYFHSCCLYGNKIYLYGGYSGNQRLSDMFAYDFETNHWSKVDCTNGEAPSGRSSLVAQVYDNCLYVFGGYNGATVLNDMYRFRLKPIGVPPPALVNDFRRLVNDSSTSDVSFLVEGTQVFAHRAILAVRSEYFRVLLFNGHMRESVLSSGGGSVVNPAAPIEIRDVSHSVFLKVLEYLYTDTVQNVNLELGIHLLVASEQFLLDRLKALSEDIIRGEIDVHNVISILVTSHQHNASGLKEIALDFILANLTDKTIRKGLSDLKEEPDLLVEIIKLSSVRAVFSPSAQHSEQQAQRQQQVPQHPPLHHPSVNGPFGAGAEWNARR